MARGALYTLLGAQPEPPKGAGHMRKLLVALALVPCATACSALAAPDSPVHSPPRVFMAGQPWLVKVNDLYRLPRGSGAWQWEGCGEDAVPGHLDPWLPGQPPVGPCRPGQQPIYTSWPAFSSAVRAGNFYGLPVRGATVIFDPETWVLTPPFEQSDQARYIQLTCQLAHRNGIRVIVTPQGPGSQLAAQWRASARYCDVVEIQSQFQEFHPSRFQAYVQSALSVIRQVSPTRPVLAALASDPGGRRASPWMLTGSYERVKAMVNGWALNVAAWDRTLAPCDPTGCRWVAIRFLKEIRAGRAR